MRMSSISEPLKTMKSETERIYDEGIEIRIVDISSMEGRGELRVSVEIEGHCGKEKKSFLVPLERLDTVKLSPKSVPYLIDNRSLELLESLDLLSHALYKAYMSLSYGSCSHKKLTKKLIDKGVRRDIAVEAVAIISDKGYIDENELAIRTCELCLKKFWGRGRIIQKLYDEGFSDEAIDNAQEYMSEIDFDVQCAELIKKRYMSVPNDRYEMQKMFASIARYGYTSTEIRNGVKLFSNDEFESEY